MAAPMSNRRGACFLSSAVGLLYAVLMVSVSEAKTFQYGDISWRTCRNVDMPYQAFYDPLFPDVCKECDSPLCIGVTINVAFKTTGDGLQSAFLENLDEDVAAYTASEGAQRQLRLVRNLPSGQDVETSELRIGYREGTGDLSIVPGSAAPDKRAGIIQCSIPPCPAVSSGDVDNYVFMIDRVSDDALTVFARYSFQLQFPRNGDYTVYFDGCCRPGILMNNQGLVFQLRAGIQLYADDAAATSGGGPRPYMKRSIKWYTPPVVHLRINGNAYESPQCTPTCGDATGQGSCSLRFQLHALHPDAHYQSQIRYRVGTANEMGHYRCYEHSVLADPTSAPQDSGICRSNQGANADDFVQPQGLHVDAMTGIVTILVTAEGQFQMTAVAECFECINSDAHATSVMADFIIRVSDAPNNGNPPVATHEDDPRASALGITGVAPRTSRMAPMQIMCGSSTFFRHSSASTESAPVYEYSEEYLRVGFKDIDDARFACQAPGDVIKRIRPSRSVPKGLNFSGALQLERQTYDEFNRGEKENPLGAAYLDVTWTPQCEDPSQVGLLMLCFEAQDESPGDPTLYSTASPVPRPRA